MKILYNDEKLLQDAVNWIFCWKEIMDVDYLERLAKFRGYGDDAPLPSEFTYNEVDIWEIEQDGIFFLNRKGKFI